jgi:cold-inducible RNA-binding protein
MKKLYVGNLSYATSEDQLKAFFEGRGRKVTDVYMPRDRETGNPRGFAFVELESAEDAQAAIQELDGQDLEGRALRINEAREPSGGGGRGGGGGGRGPGGPRGPGGGGPRGRR